MVVTQRRVSVRVLLAGSTILAMGRFARTGTSDMNDNIEPSWRILFAS